MQSSKLPPNLLQKLKKKKERKEGVFRVILCLRASFSRFFFFDYKMALNFRVPQLAEKYDHRKLVVSKISRLQTTQQLTVYN